MDNNFRNGKASLTAQPRLSKQWPDELTQEREPSLTDRAKASIAEFVSKKPATAIALGVVLGAALAWLLKRKS